MREIQLFVLLQDTVMHIKQGVHLAPNYHWAKGEVLRMHGVTNKRTSSKKLLVYIGGVYDQVLNKRQKFEDYIEKFDLSEVHDDTLDKILTKQGL